mmetsp:Transcript_12314/g.34897  ORF Transcript_12314/g.34897 Transcript_12314/m.34897 type:complete len:412 (+) Transcript_12314:347-1582(+)
MRPTAASAVPMLLQAVLDVRSHHSRVVQLLVPRPEGADNACLDLGRGHLEILERALVHREPLEEVLRRVVLHGSVAPPGCRDGLLDAGGARVCAGPGVAAGLPEEPHAVLDVGRDHPGVVGLLRLRPEGAHDARLDLRGRDLEVVEGAGVHGEARGELLEGLLRDRALLAPRRLLGRGLPAGGDRARLAARFPGQPRAVPDVRRDHAGVVRLLGLRSEGADDPGLDVGGGDLEVVEGARVHGEGRAELLEALVGDGAVLAPLHGGLGLLGDRAGLRGLAGLLRAVVDVRGDHSGVVRLCRLRLEGADDADLHVAGGHLEVVEGFPVHGKGRAELLKGVVGDTAILAVFDSDRGLLCSRTHVNPCIPQLLHTKLYVGHDHSGVVLLRVVRSEGTDDSLLNLKGGCREGVVRT